MDLSWITPQLALAGLLSADGLKALRALGIRCVVDVREEERDDEELLSAHGLSFLHLPIADGFAPTDELLAEGVTWIREQVDAGEKVLVHGQRGTGRAALICLCVLVTQGVPPDRALLLAKSAREEVAPSMGQLAAFLSFCQRHQKSAGVRWPLPDLEFLMRLAYRHLPRKEASSDAN